MAENITKNKKINTGPIIDKTSTLTKLRKVWTSAKCISIQNSRNQETIKEYEAKIESWIQDKTDQTPTDKKLETAKIVQTSFENESHELNLKCLGLYAIPPLSATSFLKDLLLRNNHIRQVNFKIFTNLHSLQRLDLASNLIENIIDANLSHHQNLRILDLSLNSIRIVDNLDLSHNPMFQQLFLDCNPLISIKNLNLSHCSILRTLYIYDHNLETLENINLSNCPELKKVSLSNLDIERIGFFDFSNSNSIHTLSLNNNKLERFPEWDISSLINLKKIYLDSNKLNDLDANLRSILPRLQTLILYNNQFLEISSELLNLIAPQLEINLIGNLFSPNTVATITAIQNMPHYQGPQFQLSIHDMLTTPTDINELPKIISKWNHNPEHPLWQSIVSESNHELILAYMNLTTFLSRLYNETPREKNEKIPASVHYHIQTILETLEVIPTDKNLLSLCCSIAKEYTETCGDKLAIGLIQLSLQCQKTQSLKSGDTKTVEIVQNSLNWLNKTILFIRNINDLKIIYNEKSQSFITLKSISDEMTQHENKLIDVNQMTTSERLLIYIKRKEEGYKLTHFQIGDEVEDILMILNKLKSEGLADIDEIEMKYRTCTTLKTLAQQNAALNFLKKN